MVNANNKEMEHVLCRPSPPLQCVACMAAGALLGGTAPGNLCPCDPQNPSFVHNTARCTDGVLSGLHVVQTCRLGCWTLL